MLRIRRAIRLGKTLNRSSNIPAEGRTKLSSKQSLRHALHAMAPTLAALLLAGIGSGVAHAQGTMDFSGAQTLMGTFKTFAMYAGAVICLGGLIFAGIRMMSGRFQDAIPELFGALFGAGVLGWGAGWIGPATHRRAPDGRGAVLPRTAGAGGTAVLRRQIAAKMGKSPAYVTTRLKLTDLAPSVVEAFYAEEIGVGHALLLAKLQTAQQQDALSACYKEVYNGGSKPSRVFAPGAQPPILDRLEHRAGIERGTFRQTRCATAAAAGNCIDCPKRTGHNKRLFSDIGGKLDCCTDPACYQSKVATHVAKTIAAKPNLVRSAPPMVRSRMAAPHFRVTSTPRYVRRNRRIPPKPSVPSSKCASSPRTQLSPMALR